MRATHVAAMAPAAYHDWTMRFFAVEGTEGLTHAASRNGFYQAALNLELRRALAARPRARGPARGRGARLAASPLRVVDAGCGPSLLLGGFAIEAYLKARAASESRAPPLELTGIEICDDFCRRARQHVAQAAPFAAACGRGGAAAARVVCGDAAGARGAALLGAADVIVHEVFGSVASVEGFTAFCKRAGPATTVVPDTAATLFQLVGLGGATRAALGAGAGRAGELVVGEHVASARALDFAALARASSGELGVLELYAGGGGGGGARAWGAAGSQEFESRFEVTRPDVVHALGCFLYLGHGDVASGGGADGRARPPARGARGAPRAHAFEELACVAARAGSDADRSARVALPRRAVSITTDQRDRGEPGAFAAVGPWRNPLLLLREPLEVARGDVVVVRSSVRRLGEKGPSYVVDVHHLRPPAGGGPPVELARFAHEYDQKQVFPWLRSAERASESGFAPGIGTGLAH